MSLMHELLVHLLLGGVREVWLEMRRWHDEVRRRHERVALRSGHLLLLHGTAGVTVLHVAELLLLLLLLSDHGSPHVGRRLLLLLLVHVWWYGEILHRRVAIHHPIRECEVVLHSSVFKGLRTHRMMHARRGVRKPHGRSWGWHEGGDGVRGRRGLYCVG